MRQQNFWALAIARFLSEPAWQFFTYWIPLYLATERHMKLKEIGYFAWVPFLAGDFGSLFGGILSPFYIKLRFSVLTARKLSATTCAILMVGAIFIGTAPTAGWAIFFFCVGAFAHQAMSATLLTLPADLFPKHTVATANGLSGSFGLTGGLIFTLIVGYVALTIGYAPLFVTIAFLDLIGSTLLWLLLREGGAFPLRRPKPRAYDRPRPDLIDSVRRGLAPPLPHRRAPRGSPRRPGHRGSSRCRPGRRRRRSRTPLP